jgi:outer membrane biosynthesis protein TonB
MAQRYLPEITQGDKRILLVDGEPVDYCLARIPQGDEFRGNLAAGGRGEGRPLSERDRWIARQVGPEMRRRGMVFVGLDVIGDYLTEVNVTSPTCIRELDAQFGLNIAGCCSTRSKPLAARDRSATRALMSAVAAPAPRSATERLSATMVLLAAPARHAVLGVGFALDDAAPVMPTLDVILTQTADAADAEAGRLPRAGQQPGRRRTRQGRAPSDTRSRHRAESPKRGAPREPLRAIARAATAAGSARDHRGAQRHRRTAAQDHADADADGPATGPAEGRARHGNGAPGRGDPPALANATPSARSASSSRPARRNTRTPVTCALGRSRRARRQPQLSRRSAPPPHRRDCVVISVAIRRDGSRSSAPTSCSRATFPMLDAAALRIVKLSEPFAPLPKTPEDPDILHVVRTWQFMPGGELIDR